VLPLHAFNLNFAKLNINVCIKMLPIDVAGYQDVSLPYFIFFTGNLVPNS